MNLFSNDQGIGNKSLGPIVLMHDSFTFVFALAQTSDFLKEEREENCEMHPSGRQMSLTSFLNLSKLDVRKALSLTV